jgi:ribosome biogenesis GTPase
LLLLDQGALLIDTPGMRELGLLDAGDGVDDTFLEILAFAANCRFADCSHTQEPGCAVRQAVTDGLLSEDRFRSYLKLKKETEYHDLSYLEKRKADRSFGRFIKSVKKDLKK